MIALSHEVELVIEEHPVVEDRIDLEVQLSTDKSHNVD